MEVLLKLSNPTSGLALKSFSVANKILEYNNCRKKIYLIKLLLDLKKTFSLLTIHCAYLNSQKFKNIKKNSC